MLRNTALATALFVGLASCGSSAPTATVQNGTYIGTYSAEYDQDYFLGIPYAQPPVGGLRFRNPVGLNATWNDRRPATQYSSEVCHLLTGLNPVNHVYSAMGTDQISGTTRCVVGR
jgi:acetylcholinesterase